MRMGQQIELQAASRSCKLRYLIPVRALLIQYLQSGRIRNGYYFAMYSKQRAGMLRDTTLPEILRSDLQEVCLQLAHQPFEISVRAFLDRLIEAPDYKAVDASLSALKDIDALTDDEQITSLGRVLASLPVHPALAKMIVLGIIFRCLDPMLILASATNIKDMFLRPLEARTEAKAARMRFSGESNSDHLALINAFDQARSYGEKNGAERCRRWLRQNFISFNLWREVYKTAEQMEQILIDRRLIKYNDVGGNYWKFGPVELNENATNEHLIKALIIAGFHPNVAATHGGPMMRTLHTDRGLMTNHSINVANMAKAIRGQLYTFSEMTKSPDGMTYTVRDNSTISPLMPIIFGRDIKPIQDRQLLVDGWLQFRLPTSVHRTMLIQFKTVVDNVLADSYNQLGSASRQIANDPLREKLSRYLGQLLFMDVKTYEQWLETQPPIPKSPKNKRKKNNRKNKNRQA
jgi:ATP-dependent RNA helicase DHX36